MKDVGEFDKRNEEFSKKFNRDTIIQNSITSDKPIIFDVGAHHGESIEYLVGLFASAKVYSFEPDPESFKVLSKKKDLSNVSFFNLALSNKVGNISFFRNRISHTNSLYKVNLESVDSIRASQERQHDESNYSEEINSEILVNTITIDKFVEDYRISHINLLKIDVQGAEELVLEGSKATLKNIESIILEVSFYDYYDHSTSFLNLEKLITPFGFKLFSILDISRNPMNGRTDWVEVLYTKT